MSLGHGVRGESKYELDLETKLRRVELRRLWGREDLTSCKCVAGIMVAMMRR